MAHYVCDIFGITLRWRHNDHDGVSNHQPHGWILKRLFRRRSKKTSKLRVTGLCVGNSPGPLNSPQKRASYAENVSIWWRHHVTDAMLIKETGPGLPGRVCVCICLCISICIYIERERERESNRHIIPLRKQLICFFTANPYVCRFTRDYPIVFRPRNISLTFNIIVSLFRKMSPLVHLMLRLPFKLWWLLAISTLHFMLHQMAWIYQITTHTRLHQQ